MSKKKKPYVPPEDVRRRTVDDAIKEIYAAKHVPITAEAAIVNQAKETHKEVMRQLRLRMDVDPMLMFDKKRVTDFLCERYINEFRKMDKETMLFILAMLHVELAMENM